ncbi:hypothetical protein QJS04_geneDACA010567 [Acorus gramineus]|uniref:Uncharacterized protein n=1 Tax=Acorus gramineus TaxID=55184 RepID=A0AAV9AME8_ACOGR|nr:hypothetical protein QJS04_geneDACA010567 [Acorus gramineus]
MLAQQMGSRDRSMSLADVNYSCGSCGYALNLSSSNRNTSKIDSKYGKAIKKGIISFFSIDERRFTQIDEFACLPYIIAVGPFRRRTNLLCGKCRSHIGYAYEETASHSVSDNSDTGSSNGNSICRKYDIKIRALQPSSTESGTLLLS